MRRLYGGRNRGVFRQDESGYRQSSSKYRFPRGDDPGGKSFPLPSHLPYDIEQMLILHCRPFRSIDPDTRPCLGLPGFVDWDTVGQIVTFSCRILPRLAIGHITSRIASIMAVGPSSSIYKRGTTLWKKPMIISVRRGRVCITRTCV